MPEDLTSDQAGAEAQTAGQAAPEVVETGTGGGDGAAQAAPASPSWKFGGNVYSDPNELHKAAQKWESDYTRKMQERAARDKETATKIGQYEAVISAIRSDPALVQQVMARMQAGQTQQQAVQGVANQLPPEVVERLGALEQKEQEREQNAAIDTFEKSHKDITQPEWAEMGDFIEKNEEWLGKLPPAKQLAVAYAECVVPKRSGSLIALGQKQKAEEIEKGKQSAFLGSQAPTAGAKPSSLPERKRGMTPAQEREFALKVFRASGKK